MRTQPAPGSAARNAFTLLELLIVIVIISVLVGLLFVAFGGVLENAAIVEVKSEFAQVDTAMTKFQDRYKILPPSSIVLTEDPGTTPWDAKSRSVLRRMFGNTVDFSQLVDFNDDGDTTDVLVLTSSECLLFFLGGMRDGTTLTGFSGNLEKPFARGGDNREGPFITFDPGRFIDTEATPDGMFEYRDLMATNDVPYIYASSNNGQGYSDTDGSVAHYHQSDGTTPWNKDTFQLISAGEDQAFGFDPEPNPFVVLTWSESQGASGEQADNITNFASGTLGN